MKHDFWPILSISGQNSIYLKILLLPVFINSDEAPLS